MPAVIAGFLGAILALMVVVIASPVDEAVLFGLAAS